MNESFGLPTMFPKEHVSELLDVHRKSVEKKLFGLF